MSKFIIGLAVLAMLVVLYAMVLRPWLRDKSWAQWFFKFVEPVELALWRKSETILFARFKMLVGIVLTALTALGAIDLSSIMPLVPDAWEGIVRASFGLLPLTITLMGWIDERLRIATTKPIEVVALPSTASPATKAAVVEAEVAVSIAVAAAATEPALKS